jgi:phospholipid/cholesterol/gamma-HCH transport system ATP-binding protein
MRHILGLEVAARGTIAVDDVVADAAHGSDDEWRRLRKRIGVMFESSALLRHITVVENVELPIVEHTGASGSAARRVACDLLEEVGLRVNDVASPSELTRAQQRHVALARAVALEPTVLLMDEPTAGLDAHAAHELDATVTHLQASRGFAVVIFSRDVRHAFRDDVEVDVLSHGRIIARGRRDDLLASNDPVVHRLMHRRGD